MVHRISPRRSSISCLIASLALFLSLAPFHARAQDEGTPKPEQHGRKYKGPPDTARIEVTVIKGFNNKPIDGAHVIFTPSKNGADEGTLELKTHPDGKATIDVIPVGSKVRIQVLADGFSTFAEDYQIDESTREITIAMIRPRAQISTYIDNHGKPAEIQPGVQEPIRPKPATPPASAPAAGASPAPSSSPNPQP
jgi:hypothetical protein